MNNSVNDQVNQSLLAPSKPKEFNLERHLTQIGITIDNVNCTVCHLPHSDKDEWCYRPHLTHLCEHCGSEFEGNLKGVSYPLLTDEKTEISDICNINK